MDWLARLGGRKHGNDIYSTVRRVESSKYNIRRAGKRFQAHVARESDTLSDISRGGETPGLGYMAIKDRGSVSLEA